MEQLQLPYISDNNSVGGHYRIRAEGLEGSHQSNNVMDPSAALVEWRLNRSQSHSWSVDQLLNPVIYTQKDSNISKPTRSLFDRVEVAN